MASNETPKKRWQIRVLNGPTRGVSRVLTSRLTIGRAATCDIHLAATSVSRQHAKIVTDDEGRHVVVDLASSNGTMVDGKPVERHVLRPNTFFTIANVDLAYEEARELPMAVTRRPRVDGLTLRHTEELRRCDATTRDYPSAEEIVGDSPNPKMVTDGEGRPMIFETPDGAEYEGNLVEDIIDYRSMRAQHLRGGFAEPGAGQRFDRLRKRLQQPPSPDPRISQRAFCRFGCWFPALLKVAEGDEYPCRVRDFGVDGAQLIIEGHRLVPETVVWLTIELFTGPQARSLVLGARVAWVDDEFIGVAFAGAPRRVQGRYAEQRGSSSRSRGVPMAREQ